MTISLPLHLALSRPDLLAPPVAAALKAWALPADVADRVRTAETDPRLADTAEFCAEYGVRLEDSVNCVIVAVKRAGETAYAACLVTATSRADINGLVRGRFGARKASFAPLDLVVSATGMEYGGVTPIGLPEDWPILVDSAVTRIPEAVVGSGIRGSKLWLPGELLAALPGALVVDGLGLPVA